jgi:hypothetical protein
MIHLHFEDSHLKTLDSRVKLFETFNSRVGAAPSTCTYAVHLFDQLGEKALTDFMPEYLVPELSTPQIRHRQGRSRSLSIYSFAKHSGATDEDWYSRYHPPFIDLEGLRRGPLRLDPTHNLEDSRGSWRAPQGVDNYIYKYIYKIVK